MVEPKPQPQPVPVKAMPARRHAWSVDPELQAVKKQRLQAEDMCFLLRLICTHAQSSFLLRFFGILLRAISMASGAAAAETARAAAAAAGRDGCVVWPQKGLPAWSFSVYCALLHFNPSLLRAHPCACCSAGGVAGQRLGGD